MTISPGYSAHETQFEGHAIRYWTSQDGVGKPPLLLLHGSGPGAGSHGNWRLVATALAASFHVIAGDLIGFGESGRKPAEPFFDFDLWRRQSAFMLGLFGRSEVNVLGHSLSGSLALKLAASDARVAKVMTTGTLGARFEANAELALVWSFPKDENELRRAGEILVYDRSLINEAYIEGRKRILYAGNYKDYFERMFSGAKQRFVDSAVLNDDEIASIRCPVLLVHGKDDRPTPCESSLAMAEKISGADYVQLAACGHSIALEHPAKLVRIAKYHFLD